MIAHYTVEKREMLEGLTASFMLWFYGYLLPCSPEITSAQLLIAFCILHKGSCNMELLHFALHPPTPSVRI